MVKPIVLANAVTTVSAGGYIICRILSIIIPDTLFVIMQAWVHTLNLSSIKANAGFSFGSELFGFIAWAIVVWLWVYASAALYNKWIK